MNLVVTWEHRFKRTPDSVIWTESQSPYSYWARYLAIFRQVWVVARVQDVVSALPGWQRADGEGVSFATIPYYIGPWQYLLKIQKVRAAAKEAFGPNDAVILYGGQIANSILPELRRTGRPYGVHVGADPYDVFAPGSISHPLRPFFRWWFPQVLRRQCVGACAVAYVTKEALQRRYPPGQGTFTIHYTDVELPETAFVHAPRPLRPNATTFNLVLVGSMPRVLYKAQDVLLDAVALCVQEGLDLRLVLVGDGSQRRKLEAQAVALGLEERVCFRGQLPAGEAVYSELDEADLFVLPSRQEGLPRAMIEAMARALPCIGSTVGGIPELLPPEDLVLSNDRAALASKIREVVTNPQRMARMSARNLEKAKLYSDEVMHQRREKFWHYVRQRTEAWLQNGTKDETVVDCHDDCSCPP